MDDLVEFLRAQFDEEEALARAAAKHVSAPPNAGVEWRRDWDVVFTAPSDPPGPRRKVADCGAGGGDMTAYLERHDPAQALREVAAKRRRVDLLADAIRQGHDDADIASELLPLEAAPYRNRPGFRLEWSPSA